MGEAILGAAALPEQPPKLLGGNLICARLVTVIINS